MSSIMFLAWYFIFDLIRFLFPFSCQLYVDLFTSGQKVSAYSANNHSGGGSLWADQTEIERMIEIQMVIVRGWDDHVGQWWRRGQRGERGQLRSQRPEQQRRQRRVYCTIRWRKWERDHQQRPSTTSDWAGGWWRTSWPRAGTATRPTGSTVVRRETASLAAIQINMRKSYSHIQNLTKKLIYIAMWLSRCKGSITGPWINLHIGTARLCVQKSMTIKMNNIIGVHSIDIPRYQLWYDQMISKAWSSTAVREGLTPLIVGMDSNTHNTAWGSPENNKRGRNWKSSSWRIICSWWTGVTSWHMSPICRWYRHRQLGSPRQSDCLSSQMHFVQNWRVHSLPEGVQEL